MEKAKKTLVAILVLLSIVVLTGCNEKKSEPKKEETTSKETVKEEEKVEETPKVDETKYSKHTVDNLYYYVPNNWEYIKNDQFEYFYPVKGNRDAFLMITTSEVGAKDITKENFDTFMNSYNESIVEQDSFKNGKLINENRTKKGDFWVSDVDFKGDMSNAAYELATRLMYDNKTGMVYTFSFIQKGSISSDNQEEYKYILSTIAAE